jgi:hypothetical protein
MVELAINIVALFFIAWAIVVVGLIVLGVIAKILDL